MKRRLFTILSALSLLLFVAGRIIVWRLEGSHVTATLGPGRNSWHWNGPPVYVGVSGNQSYVPDHWRIAERWGDDSFILLWRVTDGSRVGWYLIVKNDAGSVRRPSPALGVRQMLACAASPRRPLRAVRLRPESDAGAVPGMWDSGQEQ